MIEEDMFVKKTCRLCETGERHTTGVDAEVDSCMYWLEGGEHPRIQGFVFDGGIAREFWIPAIRCPWCGEEIE